MARCVHLNPKLGVSKFLSMGLQVGDQSRGSSKMRFSLAVVVVLVGISVSGLAQQNNTFKVKHSAPEKAPKASVPMGKTAGPATASAANAKNLQAVEHDTAKTTATSGAAGKPSGSAGKKTAPALKPVKEKPNPPINFSGTGGGKSAGTTSPGSNSHKGRVRQKHARGQ